MCVFVVGCLAYDVSRVCCACLFSLRVVCCVVCRSPSCVVFCVCCMLRIVCCLIVVVCCLLCAVYYLRCVVCGLMFVGRWLSRVACVACCLWFIA